MITKRERKEAMSFVSREAGPADFRLRLPRPLVLRPDIAYDSARHGPPWTGSAGASLAARGWVSKGN